MISVNMAAVTWCMEKSQFLSCRNFKVNNKRNLEAWSTLWLRCHATSRGREQKAGIEKNHLMDQTNLVDSGGRGSLRILFPFDCALTVVRKPPQR